MIHKYLFAMMTLFSSFIVIASYDLEDAWNRKVYQLPVSKGNRINLVIEKGDIVESQVDVIVNAANPLLRNGGGVCGAIFDAAGSRDLELACDQFYGCNAGDACITDSFGLKSYGIKYIIHAVGPDCRKILDINKQDALLKSAYTNALNLTEGIGVTSIAFPFLSSGNYGFPKERAAKIALDSVIKYLRKEATFLQSVYFVVYTYEDFSIFCQMLVESTKYIIE